MVNRRKKAVLAFTIYYLPFTFYASRRHKRIRPDGLRHAACKQAALVADDPGCDRGCGYSDLHGVDHPGSEQSVRPTNRGAWFERYLGHEIRSELWPSANLGRDSPQGSDTRGR